MVHSALVIDNVSRSELPINFPKAQNFDYFSFWIRRASTATILFCLSKYLT
jgi:hypothetical protein